MTDPKRDPAPQDIRADAASVSRVPSHPGHEQADSGPRERPLLDALLERSGQSEEPQEQSDLTSAAGLSESPAETVSSMSLAGPRTGKGSSRNKVLAGAALSLSRRHAKPRTTREGSGETRQKLMMGLIPVLAIALVFIVRNPLKVSAVPPTENAKQDVAVSAASGSVEIDWEIPPLYRPRERDPMQLPPPPAVPGAEQAAAPPAPAQTRIALTVSGILFSQDRPAAVIDTRLVHEGDEISGATVKKIEVDGVEFEMNGQTWKQAVDK